MIWKKIAATAIVLAIVLVGVFLLFAASPSPNPRGENTGLASIGSRTIVTLVILGGSAFITGFGVRDAIGRAVTMRQRSRLKKAQQQATH